MAMLVSVPPKRYVLIASITSLISCISLNHAVAFFYHHQEKYFGLVDQTVSQV